MLNVLIVEDEKKVSTLIQQCIADAGHTVQVADRPSEAKKIIENHNIDLIILDVMLPEMNGMDFARALRNEMYSGIILMLTALSTTKDIIEGLDSGADDYLTKPFEIDELLARIRALCRRKNDDKGQLKNGAISMDLITRTVIRDGIKIDLTSKEFALLEYLMRHLSKVVDRESISRQVWGADFDPESNVIDVYINHLRKKIDNPFSKKILKTVVGQGYVLNKLE